MEVQLYEKNVALRADLDSQIENVEEKLKNMKQPLAMQEVNKAIDSKL